MKHDEMQKITAIQKKKRSQKGLSLIEASMVLVLSGVVVAGVMAYYQSAQDNNKMQKSLTQLLSLVSGVNGIYANQASYEGLEDSVLINSGTVSGAEIDASNTPKTIKNAFGTQTTVGPVTDKGKEATGAAATHYALAVKKLNMAQCVKIAGQTMGTSHYSTVVVKTYDKTAEQDEKTTTKLSKISPSTMAGLCATTITKAGDTADVVFILK